jgi:hypothetical protein
MVLNHYVWTYILSDEYGILQFQAQDLGDEFKLSRGLFLGGFAALGYLYPQLVNAHS